MAYPIVNILFRPVLGLQPSKVTQDFFHLLYLYVFVGKFPFEGFLSTQFIAVVAPLQGLHPKMLQTLRQAYGRHACYQMALKEPLKVGIVGMIG